MKAQVSPRPTAYLGKKLEVDLGEAKFVAMMVCSLVLVYGIAGIVAIVMAPFAIVQVLMSMFLSLIVMMLS